MLAAAAAAAGGYGRLLLPPDAFPGVSMYGGHGPPYMIQRQFSYSGMSSTPVDMYSRPVGLPHQAFDQYGRPLHSPLPQAQPEVRSLYPSVKVSQTDSLGGNKGPHSGAPVQKERRREANLEGEAFDRRRAASRM
mmetsp:Transcript_4035/g.8267  ORF Transcript_4035/g.8267 Transcript_4035/m.8267 type:complete len:135 (+) Transcript_4035:385-789(+)